MAYEMVHPKYHEDTYSEEDVAQLCEIGDIFPDNMVKFHKDLEYMATVYRWESAKYADLPRSSDVARDLKSFLKRISRLDEGLENLPEEAAHALKKAVDSNNLTDTALIITDKLPEDVPSLTLQLPETARPVVGLNLRLSEFRHILSGLERAAQDAIVDLPERPPGRLPDSGLRLWMLNIEQLWERNTNNPFTRDETAAGGPITPAARFCVAAFQFVEPSTPASLVIREQKARIRDTRISTGRIVEKKDS